jgi:hypothetical protein
MREPEQYWIDCVSEGLDQAELSATPEQIKEIARWVESGHECYSESHGHHCIPNPETERADKAEKALRTEREKVGCKTCGGSGVEETISNGRLCTSRCWKCNGEGKHLP